MKGCIFDVRRFSTHDGGGIRTTVFFKGCPLRCVWCQNPEGLCTGVQPIWFANKCVHCGTCLHLSQYGGVYEHDDRICLKRDAAEDWDALYDACPSGALIADARWVEVEALVEELKRDAVFFRHGGGVTLSGGEPLLQGVFAAELLRRLKSEGIHTAIETALNVPLETVQATAPYLDEIFADMKFENEAAHERYTGVSNTRIKRNLAWLLTSPHREKLTIRTPLIPGMTATESNLSAISKYLTDLYPEVRYELLNYNPLAAAKYPLVDKTYCFAENPRLYTKAEMQTFGKIATENGIKHLILEI